MKISILTDVHISPEVALALCRQFPGLDAKSIQDSGWATLPDEVLLEILDKENRVLVTRDVNTIPRHCANRLADGKNHAGVILADSKKLLQTDTRGLIRRLAQVIEKRGDEDWRCRIGWL